MDRQKTPLRGRTVGHRLEGAIQRELKEFNPGAVIAALRGEYLATQHNHPAGVCGRRLFNLEEGHLAVDLPFQLFRDDLRATAADENQHSQKGDSQGSGIGSSLGTHILV